YKQTLDVGEMVEFFCVDEENDRVIGYFPNREHQIGYFNLNTK
ncbi:6-bladed beta-propeller, partial [Marinilabiliaceae bacterium JC017]